MYAEHPFGSILLQQIQTEGYRLNYYIFSFLQQVSLFGTEENGGLQSLLSLKGGLQFGFKGRAAQTLAEGQFTLLDARTADTETIVPGGRECHLINTYYTGSGYEEWLPHFPALKKALRDKGRKPRFLLPSPRPARHTLLDAVQEVLQEQYQPELQRIFWEMKVRQALFTQLAQAYTEPDNAPATQLELQMAERAQAIIMQDISRHYPNDQLARMVGWSESSLKRAFQKVYGSGLYEYLRTARMERARELLLRGEQVKTVAPTVGMRPSNFTMEFQKYFGYKATSLRKGTR
ncbi:AraC family transcriptional regulator [Flaviaesturariibacter amylovorans]|uniref:HTH araC/xylS-type domain-containing protein n=1 Tax=Flaviaesturariibacter amylovorans TaxID=1084520 RepID=A0ABP8HIK7_9BACT